jgi:hypothetical protein
MLAHLSVAVRREASAKRMEIDGRLMSSLKIFFFVWVKYMAL